MNRLTLLIPDPIMELVLGEAANQGVDATALCSSAIVEHFLGQRKTMEGDGKPIHESATPYQSESAGFNVKEKFPGYPPASIELAQLFVDEALKFPHTHAFKAISSRGVGVHPNFVFIEYLRKRSPGGIGVSFYGGPNLLRHPGLRPGRNPNYSRTTASTQSELRPLLQLVRRSYQLRFGHST